MVLPPAGLSRCVRCDFWHLTRLTSFDHQRPTTTQTLVRRVRCQSVIRERHPSRQRVNTTLLVQQGHCQRSTSISSTSVYIRPMSTPSPSVHTHPMSTSSTSFHVRSASSACRASGLMKPSRSLPTRRVTSRLHATTSIDVGKLITR